MIRVTVVVELEQETWGADDAYADGGEKLVLELIQEDLHAFLTDPSALWTVEKVDSPVTT